MKVGSSKGQIKSKGFEEPDPMARDQVPSPANTLQVDLPVVNPAASSEKAIRILLIDEHTIVRAGYRMLIEVQPMMLVVAEASRDEAIDIAERETPDIILLGLDPEQLNLENDLDLISELAISCPATRVLALNQSDNPGIAQAAAHSGAMGLINKNDSVPTLIKAIEKVHSGEAWFDRSILGALLGRNPTNHANQQRDAKIATLTERERGVITLIAEGLKNRQIAERLFISETTVTHHLSSIFSKLGVSDRLELVIYAFAHKLARMPQ